MLFCFSYAVAALTISVSSPLKTLQSVSDVSRWHFTVIGYIRYVYHILWILLVTFSSSHNIFLSPPVREPEGFYIWNGPPFSNGQPRIKLDRIPCTNVKFSEDGSRLMVMKSDSSIGIYDCSTFKEMRSFQVPNVGAAALSPCGTYLQTFQKSSTPQEKNVVLWKAETGDAVYRLFQKNMTKASW